MNCQWYNPAAVTSSMLCSGTDISLHHRHVVMLDNSSLQPTHATVTLCVADCGRGSVCAAD